MYSSKSLLLIICFFLASCTEKYVIDQHSKAYSDQSDSLLRLERYEEARNAIDMALSLDSMNYVALNNRAVIAGQIDEDFESAERDILTALKINPDYKIGKRSLIACKFAQGEHDNVVSLANQYISKYGESYDVLFKLAEAYNMLGKHSKSLPLFNQILEDKPEYAPGYKERSVAHRHLGEMQIALIDAIKATELDSTYPQAFNNLGVVYMESGQYERALEAFTNASRLDSTSHMYYYNRGIVKIDKLSRKTDGCRDLLKSISLGSSIASREFERKCR
jgi:tetratricopeptide (TPR) repeat protein